LAAAIDAHRKRHHSIHIFLNADHDAAWSTVMEVRDAARWANDDDVAWLTEPGS
jgi:biopolymer transport protein ExbD